MGHGFHAGDPRFRGRYLQVKGSLGPDFLGRTEPSQLGWVHSPNYCGRSSNVFGEEQNAVYHRHHNAQNMQPFPLPSETF